MTAYSAAIAYGKNDGTSYVTQAKGIAAQNGYVADAILDTTKAL